MVTLETEPLTDYLLGTTMESFEDEEVLSEILEDSEDQVLEVYVYNTESDVVRVVSLVPGGYTAKPRV